MKNQAAVIRIGHQHILYDADVGVTPDAGWFEPRYLDRQGMLTGGAAGRGRAWFFTAAGRAFVLRHYRRGGWLANRLRDRYLWTGIERTRAWREWHLLAWMVARGLPVPAPIAARVVRSQAIYRGDLITTRVPGAQSLAERLMRAPLPGDSWMRIGQVIRRFHAAGIEHADLNAHNILIDPHDRVSLIDFDRARLRRQGSGWPRGNLRRLQRSLKKLQARQVPFHYRDGDYGRLTAGYHAG